MSARATIIPTSVQVVHPLVEATQGQPLRPPQCRRRLQCQQPQCGSTGKATAKILVVVEVIMDILLLFHLRLIRHTMCMPVNPATN